MNELYEQYMNFILDHYRLREFRKMEPGDDCSSIIEMLSGETKEVLLGLSIITGGVEMKRGKHQIVFRKESV